MNVWRLVVKEIAFRKLNFALGVVSVAAAVGCLVGQLTLLTRHDQETERIVAEKQAQTQADMDKLRDDYRKITKRMGFNLLILPKDQNLGDFYANDFAAHDMPEAYVEKLAGSRVVTVRHLLPSIQKKLKWPEQSRTVILIGTRGEVPLIHRDPKKPILAAIEPGQAVLGYELHRSLKLAKGGKLTFMGQEFTVAKCHPERGNKDDITIWIDLAQAQALLGTPGRINAILALKCHCAGMDLAKVRGEVAEILPDTQVIEFASKALARAEARDRAEAAAKQAIAAEKANRARLRRQREAFAAVLVPIVILASTVWIGSLAFANVRDRRAEIGILRALGLRSRHILAVFLLKAATIGLLGAAAGHVAGFLIAARQWQAPGASSAAILNIGLFLTVLAAAPVVACLASLMPAMAAVQQDPAAVLQEE